MWAFSQFSKSHIGLVNHGKSENISRCRCFVNFSCCDTVFLSIFCGVVVFRTPQCTPPQTIPDILVFNASAPSSRSIRQVTKFLERSIFISLGGSRKSGFHCNIVTHYFSPSFSASLPLSPPFLSSSNMACLSGGT